MLLEDKNMSQQELADSLGITKSAVSNYISGDRVPRVDLLAKIADVLNVSLEYLLSGRSETTTRPDAYHEIKNLIQSKGQDLTSEEIMDLISSLTSTDKKNRDNKKTLSKESIKEDIYKYLLKAEVTELPINIARLCEREGIILCSASTYNIQANDVLEGAINALKEINSPSTIYKDTKSGKTIFYINDYNQSNYETRFEIAKLFVQTVIDGKVQTENIEYAAMSLLFPPVLFTNEEIRNAFKDSAKTVKVFALPRNKIAKFMKESEETKNVSALSTTEKEVYDKLIKSALLRIK